MFSIFLSGVVQIVVVIELCQDKHFLLSMLGHMMETVQHVLHGAVVSDVTVVGRVRDVDDLTDYRLRRVSKFIEVDWRYEIAAIVHVGVHFTDILQQNFLKLLSHFVLFVLPKENKIIKIVNGFCYCVWELAIIPIIVFFLLFFSHTPLR